MDNLFLRFINKLNVKATTDYESCSFSKATNNKETGVFEGVIKTNPLPYHAARALLTAFDNAPFKLNIRFDYLQAITGSYLYNLFKDEYLTHTGSTEDHIPEYQYDIKNRIITFIFHDLGYRESFKATIETWEELLNDLSIDVEISLKMEFSNAELKRREEIIKAKLPAIQAEYEANLKTRYVENENSQRTRGNYVEIKLKDANENSGNVKVIGKIFHAEDIRISKKGKAICSFFIYDGTSSIECIAFENNRIFKREFLESLVANKPSVEIKGFISRSTYNNEVQLKCDTLKIDEEFSLDEKVEDTYETKRVELHCHTKMSTMDAVSSISDYAALAKKWGMKAIAVTDHGNAQAFPEAQKAAIKNGLKMIYGTELYMVDEQLDYVFNPSDIVLNKATYVVFDFETTGLSARYDRIFEFGAVKFKDGMIVDNIDFFIDPEVDIPPFIQEKTHVSNHMVRGKTKIKEALKRMREFIGDSILVAHNASFDYGFLNEAFKNNGEEEVKNPVIDTLALAWYLFPNSKSHSLGGVARQFDIDYDETSAHRANYDAEVLNNVWQAMLVKLTKDNLELKHKDLMNLRNEQIVKNARVKHVIALAKNPEGLKDLFRIISLSCTDYFAQVPRTPRRIIEQYRENLLIGSACFNSEVFEAAMTRSETVLKQKMKFYDYIEVQPLDNYSFLVNDRQVSSMDKVERYIKDMIKAADDLGKITVATSDCHYARPASKEFRDVYIYAKAVGGLRHPLNPNRREKQPRYENPNQHMRSTDEMMEAFNFLNREKAYEIVVKNTNLIADQIEELYPCKTDLYPPIIENCDQKLIDRVYQRAHQMYGDPLPKEIEERLSAELNGIIKYGYSVQFYIASEIVRQANKDGYIVGSRGSVGSSFVATMSDITEVNALPPHYLCPNSECKHLEFAPVGQVKSGYDLPKKQCPKCGTFMKMDGQNLPFATFLGFNAEKVPDIDLNFPGDYQWRAHLLTKDFLGNSGNDAYRAGTIETVAEKTAYGFVLGYLRDGLHINPDEVSNAEKTRIAMGCRDVKRTTGQHPGGIIVIPANYSVFDFTPYQYPADDLNATWKTTHFDFHAIHDNVLKLDLLGHVDPVALRFLYDVTGINPITIPMNDEKVYSLFNSRDALNCDSNYLGETTGALGLPEFGTNLTRNMLEEIRPKNFADLVMISGLSHGTDVWAGNAQELLKNKVCGVEGVIACRDDVMIYLQQHGIENSIAFKTMEAVRKGKQIPKDYLPLLIEAKVPDYYIESANKCKYLFPKAHAVAYVTMAVRIAWYKLYHPLAYYACFFTTRAKAYDIKAMIDGKDAIIMRIEQIRELKKQRKQSPKDEEVEKTLLIALEMAERGFKVENIDLYRSDATRFTVDLENKAVIPPFLVIDGLGEGPATSVVEARNKRRFTSQEDLTYRTSLNQTTIETLRKLHVLDDLPEEDQMTLF